MRILRWVTLAVTLLSAGGLTAFSLLLWSEESRLRPESVTIYPLLTATSGLDPVQQVEIVQRGDDFRLGQRVCLVIGLISGAVHLLTVNVDLGTRRSAEK